MSGEDALQTFSGVGEFIVEALNRRNDEPAFIMDERTWTYRDVREGISRAAQAMQALGLERGDAVVQLAHNRPEQWFVSAAAFLSGLRSVALHTLGGAQDHVHIIGDSQARAVIVDRAFAGQAAEYRLASPGVRHWLSHDSDAGLDTFWEGAAWLKPLPLKADAAPEEIVRLGYTGGTTGLPKGVMLSSRSLLATALLSLAEWELPQETRLLCAAPISHGAASLILPTLWRGGTVHLAERFQADAFIDLVERHRITGFYAVPTMLYALMDHPRAATADWSSVDFILYGGAPISPDRLGQAIDLFGPVLNQSYGQTEAPSCITLLRKRDHLDPAGQSSCGRPYPGVRVGIRDENDRLLPTGRVGEICVQGPHVMSGYWNQPEQTADALRGGWLRTGDLGFFDEMGFLHLADRKRDLIISGGFNVYPRAVEDALASHPAVAAAAVIGAPDPKWGEMVTAFVVLHADAGADTEALRSHVKALKGSVMAPKQIIFLDHLPLTPLGKPDRKALRALWAAGNASPA